MSMITVQDMFMIVLGILACFAGYSMFREMLPVWGFVLGGWIAYTFLPVIVGAERAEELIIRIVGVGIGALAGAAIAIPAYYVIVFLSGAALGMLIGVMLGALIDIGGITSIRQLSSFTVMVFPPSPQSAAQFLFMTIGGLLMGVMAINFQKFMICASSAFLGAAAVITGLGAPIASVSASEMGASAMMLTSWLVLGMIGLFVQFRMLGEV
jgi:hypothetical protein